MLEKLSNALGMGLAIAAAGDTNASDPAEILAIERRWSSALVARDIDALEEILADDFVMLWIDGRQIRKADVLAGTAARKARVNPFTTEDVEIRVYGNAAVVTGRASLTICLDGRSETNEFSYTDVYVRSPSGWRAVSAQSVLSRLLYSDSKLTGRSEDPDDHERDVVRSAALQDHVEQGVGGDVERVHGHLVEQLFVLDEAR